MQSTIQCTCGKHLDANAQKPGDRAQCPACGNVFVIGELVKTTAIQPKTLAKTTQFSAARTVAALPELPAIETPSGRTWGGTLVVGIILCVPLAMFAVGAFCIRPMGGGDGVLDIASTQIKGPLSTACQAFERKNGRWPENLEELLQKNDKGGPYLENLDCLLDPWGNRYQYDSKGPRNNAAKPDIWAVDPRNGTKVGNWQAIH